MTILYYSGPLGANRCGCMASFVIACWPISNFIYLHCGDKQYTAPRHIFYPNPIIGWPSPGHVQNFAGKQIGTLQSPMPTETNPS